MTGKLLVISNVYIYLQRLSISFRRNDKNTLDKMWNISPFLQFFLLCEIIIKTRIIKIKQKCIKT